MSTLIVYYSLEGNTKFVASEIAKHLGADLLELKPKKNYSTGVMKYFSGGKDVMTGKKPELEPFDFAKNQYDAIVVGTPVWAASMAPPVRTFLEAYDFSDKKVGFFACCGGGETQKCFDNMSNLCNVKNPVTLRLINPLRKKTIENDIAIRDFSDQVYNL